MICVVRERVDKICMRCKRGRRQAHTHARTYTLPTYLLALNTHAHTHSQHTCFLSQVTGEEEIPEGVVAVLTPDAPDVLSHVSVRARNMRVLFATCHDPEPLDQIKVCALSTLS